MFIFEDNYINIQKLTTPELRLYMHLQQLLIATPKTYVGCCIEISQKELCSQLNTHSSNMSVAVKHLKEQGYILYYNRKTISLNPVNVWKGPLTLREKYLTNLTKTGN